MMFIKLLKTLLNKKQNIISYTNRFYYTDSDYLNIYRSYSVEFTNCLGSILAIYLTGQLSKFFEKCKEKLIEKLVEEHDEKRV